MKTERTVKPHFENEKGWNVDDVHNILNEFPDGWPVTLEDESGNEYTIAYMHNPEGRRECKIVLRPVQINMIK